MLKIKTFTKIISMFLAIIMIIEIMPLNAIGENIINLSGTADESDIQEEYNSIYNVYYGSHSMDIGRAGTLSINDYTLIPSITYSSLGIDGNIFPVSISMIYNSVEYRFLKEIVGYTALSYGKGWNTNYSSALCELQYEDKTQIAYLTGNGSVILFEQAEFDETDMDVPEGTTKWVTDQYDGIIYKATDSYAMSAEAEINGNHMQYAMVMQNDDSIRLFDVYGRMCRYGNMTYDTSTNIFYESTGNSSMAESISKITDGVGNEYRFTYTNGLLTKIKCYNSDGNAIISGSGDNAAPLEMNFGYSNGNLTSVTYPDGKTVSYTYNSLNAITSAVNIDGYKVEIQYSDGYISKISEFALNADNKYIAGKYLDITWSGNTRTFTDSNGNVQIKTFDDNGEIVSIVDGDGNYLYGGITEEESTSLTEEESTGVIIEETTEEIFVSKCPCSECQEWECLCECEDEESCTCIQCKRKYSTVEDASGNILSDESYDGERTMKTVNTYTSDGSHIASSVDTSGNTVYYVYDEAGMLSSMTSGDMEVLFEYDAMGNLTELSQEVSGLSNGSVMSNQYTYSDDRIASITHNGFTYNFTYDEWGNQTSVKINDRTLTSYEYGGEDSSRLSKINYANGQSVTYSYDDSSNITAISYDGGETAAFEFEYTDGALTKITDNNAGYVTAYSENGTEIRNLDDNRLLYSSVYNVDGTQTENILGSSITYTYNSDYNQVTGKTVSSVSFSADIYVEGETGVFTGETDAEITNTSDWFGRTESKNISIDTSLTSSTAEETSEYYISGEYEYTYNDTEDAASTKILSHSSNFTANDYSYSRTDNYEYDETGNITGIYRYDDGIKTYYYTYEYDEAGQLVRENILEDNKTILYVYDKGGNIVSKTEYEYTLDEITEEMEAVRTDTYTYGDDDWKDLLTNHTVTDAVSTSDNINTNLTYDAMGNVTSYNGTTYTWTAGRQLSSSQNGNDRYRYHFNENGYLSRIDIYDEDTDSYPGGYVFIWDGDRLVSRSVVYYESNTCLMTSRIIYDTDGESIGFTLNYSSDEKSIENAMFLYRKNLQGDITGIIGTNGQLLAEFTYDAYGNMELHPHENSLNSAILSIFMVVITPQLYRGYIYVPLGGDLCYYLGSRFYVPQLGRFLNADIHADTGTGVVGTNMFAYCNNNPVMFLDPTGEALEGISILQVIVKYVSVLLTLLPYLLRANSDSNGLLCYKLYKWGFNKSTIKNAYYDFSSSWGNLIVKRLKKSIALETAKYDYKYIISEMKKKNIDEYYRLCHDLTFYNTSGRTYGVDDWDLLASIGLPALMKVGVIHNKVSNVYYVTYELKDEYFDFDDWSKTEAHTKNPIIYLLNQVGYFYQNKSFFKPFYWGFKLTFSVKG